LSGRIPDLGFDATPFERDVARREFHVHGRKTVVAEALVGEAAQQLAFPNAGISDEDKFQGVGLHVSSYYLCKFQ